MTVEKAGNCRYLLMARKFPFGLLTASATILLGLFSYSYGLLFFCCLALATALQAVLMRAGRGIFCVLFLVPALALAYLVAGWVALLPILSCPVAAFFLSRLSCRGESRSSMAAVLGVVYAGFLLAAVLLWLFLMMRADGNTDFLAYIDHNLGEVVRSFTEACLKYESNLLALYEKLQVTVALRPLEVVREEILFYMSLLPSLFLFVCALVAIGATYLLQLVGLFANDNTLFTQENRIYRPSALLGVAYLLSLPIGFLWVDIRDPLCLTCMNLAVFLTPVLAFGAILHAPLLIAFMRRMANGMLDFVFFLVLLILFFLANLVYALFILAALYAFYLLKSTLFPRQKTGRK